MMSLTTMNLKTGSISICFDLRLFSIPCFGRAISLHNSFIVRIFLLYQKTSKKILLLTRLFCALYDSDPISVCCDTVFMSNYLTAVFSHLHSKSKLRIHFFFLLNKCTKRKQYTRYQKQHFISTSRGISGLG